MNDRCPVGTTFLRALLLLAIAFSCASASAGTLRVPAEYPTITWAIDSAVTGDTVLVAPGFYNEWIVFSGKRITVRSEEGPDKTFIGKAIFQNGETRESTLIGFSISNPGSGVHISGSSPTILSNVVDVGLFAQGLGPSRISPVIRGNVFRGLGLDLQTCEEVIVEGNSIEGVIQANFCTSVIVTNNIIRGGIYANQTAAVYVHQNLIYGFTGVAFSWGPFTYGTVASLSHNTIVSDAVDGTPAIELRSNQWLRNCIVVGNPAIRALGGTIVNNLLFAPGGGPVATDMTGLSEGGNRIADPRFVDASHYNYRLQMDSPAIDQSDPFSVASSDLDGASRPLDGNDDWTAIADLGCYEFVPFLPTPPLKLDGISLPVETQIWWDAAFTATNYFVSRGLSPSGPFELLGSTAIPAFVDKSITTGVNYYYVVASGSGNGIGSTSPPLMIRGGNRPPTSSPDDFIIKEGDVFEFNPFLNDTDPDGDSLSVVSLSPVNPGWAGIVSSNKIRFESFQDEFGVAEFTYIATDGWKAYSTGKVTVTIDFVNNPPFVFPFSLEYDPDQTAFFQVQIIDTDTTGQQVQILEAPTHGILQSPGGLFLSYRPPHGFVGHDFARFRILDGDQFTDGSCPIYAISGEGLSDAEILLQYWGGRYGVLNPSDDDDHDGMTNMQEYWADTSPKDPASRLEVSSIQRTPEGFLKLEWNAIGGVRYRVHSADVIEGSVSFSPLTERVEDEFETASSHSATKRSYVDRRAVNPTGARLYRLEVVQ